MALFCNGFSNGLREYSLMNMIFDFDFLFFLEQLLGGYWNFLTTITKFSTNPGDWASVFMFTNGKLKMDQVIGGKFKLGRKIGSGSFGELYLGNALQSLDFIYCNMGFFLMFIWVVCLLAWLMFRCQRTNWRGDWC